MRDEARRGFYRAVARTNRKTRLKRQRVLPLPDQAEEAKVTRTITNILIALSRSLRMRVAAPAPARRDFCSDCIDVARCVELGSCYRSYVVPDNFS